MIPLTPQTLAAKVGVILITLLVVAGISSRVTYNYCKGQEATKLLKAKEISDSMEKRLTEALQQARLEYFNNSQIVHTVTKTIYKEIPQAIKNEIDSKFPISNWFVRMYDTAASVSEIPRDAYGDDSTPSEIGETTVISSVANNFETCNIQREQLIVWQKAYLEYRKQMKEFE